MNENQNLNAEPEVMHRRYLATARTHERIAEVYEAYGKTADAQAARKAARGCRATAADMARSNPALAKQSVQNLKQAQHEYAEARKAALALAKTIERAILDMPIAANGNWALVGDAKRLVAELQAINDRLYGTGEFAG